MRDSANNEVCHTEKWPSIENSEKWQLQTTKAVLENWLKKRTHYRMSEQTGQNADERRGDCSETAASVKLCGFSWFSSSDSGCRKCNSVIISRSPLRVIYSVRQLTDYAFGQRNFTSSSHHKNRIITTLNKIHNNCWNEAVTSLKVNSKQRNLNEYWLGFSWKSANNSTPILTSHWCNNKRLFPVHFWTAVAKSAFGVEKWKENVCWGVARTVFEAPSNEWMVESPGLHL